MDLRETKSTVVTTIISSQDGRNTYEIRKDFPDLKGKTAVIIMLFPGTSYTDILKVDSTSQSLINHVQELGINRLRMVNIFSKVCSARMSVKNIQPDNENLTYLEGIMKEKEANTFLWIVAWGSSMASSKIANQMKKQIIISQKKYLPTIVLKQLMVDGLDNMQNESALHPLFLKIRYANSHWLLEDYKIPKEMLLPESQIESTKQTNTNQNASNEDKENLLTDKVKKQIKGNPKYVVQE